MGKQTVRTIARPGIQKEFVIYANAKGMLVAHNVAAYFCEEHNPMYDAKRAAAEGYKMFCQPGECPFDLLKYGIDQRNSTRCGTSLPRKEKKHCINIGTL